jgi:hypothetical protein
LHTEESASLAFHHPPWRLVMSQFHNHPYLELLPSWLSSVCLDWCWKGAYQKFCPWKQIYSRQLSLSLQSERNEYSPVNIAKYSESTPRLKINKFWRFTTVWLKSPCISVFVELLLSLLLCPFLLHTIFHNLLFLALHLSLSSAVSF